MGYISQAEKFLKNIFIFRLDKGNFLNNKLIKILEVNLCQFLPDTSYLIDLLLNNFDGLKECIHYSDFSFSQKVFFSSACLKINLKFLYNFLLLQNFLRNLLYTCLVKKPLKIFFFQQMKMLSAFHFNLKRF